MRFTSSSLLAFAALTLGAHAQQDLGAQLTTALRSSGLTAVADLVGSNTQLLSSLEGKNVTILAPTNEALAASPADANRLSLIYYHILEGTFATPADFAAGKGRAIDTFLLGSRPTNPPQVVILGGDGTSSYVTSGNGTRSNIVTQGNGAIVGNVAIQSIDRTLSLPDGFVEVLAETSVGGASALRQILQATNLTPVLDNLVGTIFIPETQALLAAAGALATSSTPEIRSILLNHIINNTVIFTNPLSNNGNGKLTTASGRELTLEQTADTVYVNFASVKARVLQSNLLADGGVVHVIDAALIGNTNGSTAGGTAAPSSTRIPGPTLSFSTGSTPSRTGSPDAAMSIRGVNAATAGLFAIAASALVFA